MTDNILVFSHGELIGDGMMKLPFLKALRSAYPTAKITWLAGRHPTIFNSALRPVIAEYIDHVIDHTKLGDSFLDIFSKPWRQYLGDTMFDVIFDTEHKIIPSLMLRSIPHKEFISASHNFFFSSKKPPQGYKRPMMLRDRLLDLIQVATGKKQEVDVEMNIPHEWLVKSQEILASLNPNKLSTVLLAPGAGGRFKCWPLANFINLAKQIEAFGALPLFILGPAETEWQADIQKEIPNALFPLQMTTEKSVYLTIGLASLANACVANDGGVGHILASSNTFTISMWGPTDPLKSTPNGKNVKVVTSQQFGGDSMDYIPVSSIFDYVKSYLQGQ